MGKFLLRRLVFALLIFWGVTVLIFLLVQLMPGDAAKIIMGPQYDPEFYEILAKYLGLDKPLYAQYLDWLTKAFHGDLGISIAKKLPVKQALANKVPNSLILAASGLLFAIVIGFPSGFVSATRRGTVVDAISRTIAVAGVSTPSYWWALMAIYLFSVRLRWLPAMGMYDLRNPGGLPDLLRHLILPSVVVGTPTMAVVAKITRSSMLDVLGQPYILAARAKGLLRLVYLKHVIRNILVPVVSAAALQVGYLFGSALFVEIIFSWPGVGRLVWDAVLAHDLPVLQGTLLVVSFVFIVSNLFADLVQVILDPRIRRPSE